MIYSRWVSPSDGFVWETWGEMRPAWVFWVMTPWLGNNSGGRKAGGPASTFPRQIFKKIQRRDNSVLVLAGLPDPALNSVEARPGNVHQSAFKVSVTDTF